MGSHDIKAPYVGSIHWEDINLQRKTAIFSSLYAYCGIRHLLPEGGANDVTIQIWTVAMYGQSAFPPPGLPPEYW